MRSFQSKPNPKSSRAAIITAALVTALFSMSAEAKPKKPTGLRGGNAAVATPANPAQAWLGQSIWRATSCDKKENFQTFSFTPTPQVEVGSGRKGEGEKLELLRVGTSTEGLIEIETRVCAPVGCNQTVERYKKIGPSQMQEWHFEGRLPEHQPYVLVRDGQAVDGSGPGRLFNRCTN
ncbi:MAG: hypothetical protein CFE32_02690 [Alphaproteobacteria bacterium PA3]|jgi:hypothetical protein|nr:MAG: hypothetical protein CFE32_02690 [Alphaproteobacteria bacterium PA3]